MTSSSCESGPSPRRATERSLSFRHRRSPPPIAPAAQRCRASSPPKPSGPRPASVKATRARAPLATLPTPCHGLQPPPLLSPRNPDRSTPRRARRGPLRRCSASRPRQASRPARLVRSRQSLRDPSGSSLFSRPLLLSGQNSRGLPIPVGLSAGHGRSLTATPPRASPFPHPEQSSPLFSGGPRFEHAAPARGSVTPCSFEPGPSLPANGPAPAGPSALMRAGPPRGGRSALAAERGFGRALGSTPSSGLLGQAARQDPRA